MSGSSLDGVDLAIIDFYKKKNKWKFKLLEFNTISYDYNLKNELSVAHNLNLNQIKKLDSKYTFVLASLINNFLEKLKINIDFVSSHGHTILHQPEKGVTIQIGNNIDLSNLISKKLICDFRTQDVLFGGQGAPLVPVGDYHLFSEFDYTLNLGGFANITNLTNQFPRAHDVCAVNTVLNKLSNELNLDYDSEGRIAMNGNLIKDLKNELDNILFYKDKPPKSLGVEWLNRVVYPILNKYKSFKIEDILYTYSIHISEVLSRELPEGKKILLSGGGSFNNFLIDNIVQKSKSIITIPNKEIINFKEAIIFAFIGVLKIRNEINCFKSVTGACKDHCSGVIYN